MFPLGLQKRPLRRCANGRLLLVGLAGLEPATFRPPDGRATRLRHSPTCEMSYAICGLRQEGIGTWLFFAAQRHAITRIAQLRQKRRNRCHLFRG